MKLIKKNIFLEFLNNFIVFPRVFSMSVIIDDEKIKIFSKRKF